VVETVLDAAEQLEHVRAAGALAEVVADMG